MFICRFVWLVFSIDKELIVWAQFIDLSRIRFYGGRSSMPVVALP
ncbi:hypothetical protein PM8797T_26760 [Gimesia maris DSM 8797]|nr:hypothetical protein PM8797T_26760 [Gimesia maris DSM 8797]